MTRGPRRPVALAAAGVYALNVWILWKWFGIGWLDAPRSIEVAFVGIGRYMADHWHELTWFPLWYGGVPFENVYPPLLHALSASLIAVFDATPSHAYHIVSGLFYCLGPASLVLLTARLSGRLSTALAAGLLHSAISPSLWLAPSYLADSPSADWLRRLYNLANYGEGPHIAAAALIPLAVIALDRAAARPKPERIFVAAAAAAAVALANWLGAFALVWAALAWIASRGFGELRRTLWIGGATAAWAYALAASWLPPQTVAVVSANARISGAAYPMDATRYALLAALAFAATMVGLAVQARAGRLAAFSVAFALPMLTIPLVDEYAKFHLIPQPHRYQIELETAVCLLLALVFGAATARARARTRAWAAGVLGLALLFPAWRARSAFNDFVREAPMEDTLTYAVAEAARALEPPGRLYSLASVRFGLMAFGDIPQFGGGFAQAVINPVWWTTDYGIYFTGREHAELTVLWFKAYGIDYVVAGPDSGEQPRVWNPPDRYEGLLDAAWRKGGNALYRVPRRNRSLAHVVPGAALVKRTPINIFDNEEAEVYVDALENPSAPLASFGWIEPDRALIEASPGPGDVLSVQISYDSRWKAFSGDRRLATRRDGLGQLVVEPLGAGNIRLEYRPDLWPRLLSWTALLAGVLVLVRAALKARGGRGSSSASA